MNRYLLIVLTLLTVLGCQSGKEKREPATQERHVTRADLAGKTFVAALPDTASALKGLTENELAHMSMQYLFSADSTGTFRVSLNNKPQDTPFTWRFSTDSLYVTHKGGTDRFRVNPQFDGYDLRSQALRVFLRKP